MGGSSRSMLDGDLHEEAEELAGPRQHHHVIGGFDLLHLRPRAALDHPQLEGFARGLVLLAHDEHPAHRPEPLLRELHHLVRVVEEAARRSHQHGRQRQVLREVEEEA